MTHPLSILIFLPLVAAFLVAILPIQAKWLKWITAAVCGMELLVSLNLTLTSGYSSLENYDWISLSLGSFGMLSIKYLVGIDGISLPLVILTAFVMLIGSAASWKIDQRQKAYFSLYLLLSSAIMGCFLALDFFLFFLFFEFMLLPMYFLIGLWGGERREYASLKFFLYTLFGSLLILLVMIGLYLSATDPSTQSLTHTFDFRYLSDLHNYLPNSILSPLSQVEIWGIPARTLAFWLLFIGFAIKLPIVPLHTWLPDAHVEAPTPVSVVLAGILLKVGGYGLIRVLLPIFPTETQQFAPVLGIIATISIVYGGFNALAQYDLKKMIAFSSVSHMGFVLLGVASLTSEGLNGAIFQMVSHGILSAMLFLIAGVLYDRTHDRLIENYRGLVGPMPNYTILTGIAFFASLGLPLFSGFIGELFTLMGGFQSKLLPTWISATAALGIILAAAYFLWTFQRMFLGEFWQRKNEVLIDLTLREKIMLIPLALLTLSLGLWPRIVFDMTNVAVLNLLKQLEKI